MTAATGVIAVVLAAAALLTLVRLVRGPGLLDRVVALDCLLVILVMAVAVESATGRRSGIALSIVVSAALLSFVGTVAVARYVERSSDRGDTADRLPGEPGSAP